MKRPTSKAAGLVLVSAALLTSITAYEGREFVPYKDMVGVWTVCAGITGRHVIPGKTYTKAECDALESGEIERHGLQFLACTTHPLRQNEYEAFTSLAYNVGPAAICRSGRALGRVYLIDLINAGRLPEACDRIMAYNKAGGVPVRGLTNRRASERARCLEK